ncbi:hypothetical protein EHO60_13320 [Leptospira fletcheri]|uniref:Uncharacterized protein n=1 Tax=Leptospira fletcheri TaxID=2484981 RepID=A0A4V3JD81_9LEPT|nr:hypothetical protein [Leptospira fletcheri]TGK08999.1 hypothetical protein EHO60_13320 [Leptospira fletcheri]
MKAFLQMGHHSENLVGEKGLSEFSGIILSPVNRLPDQLASDTADYIKKGYSVLLDPQLYFPATERQKLTEQPYFPDDMDTSDLSSLKWWKNLSDKLSSFCIEIGIKKTATPAPLTRNSSNDEYYSLISNIGASILEKSKGVEVYQTVIVHLPTIDNIERIYRIASLVSNSDYKGYYLVFLWDKDPRNEIDNETMLFYAMELIYSLANLEKEIIVSHSGTEMPLYIVAGASSCASGKFFNLRRFTSSRYEEPTEQSGGGQLPYWFEQGYMAFLRQTDYFRIKTSKLSSILGTGYSSNLWSKIIEEQLVTDPEKAWLSHSWRHYLSWFSETHKYLKEISNPGIVLSDWLKLAESNWEALESEDILMDEKKNDGRWLRPWRQALGKFKAARK